MMPHGSHIYATASDMANATMCAYPQSEHSLPLWNMYCDYVMTVHVSIFLIKKLQMNMTKLHQQFGFTFITPLDVVLLMVDFH